VLYSLLSENYRFSRAIIIMGAAWGTIAMFGTRLFLHMAGLNGYKFNAEKNKRFIIVGEQEEAKRVSDLLHLTVLSPGFVGLVSYHHHRHNSNGFIGHIGQIREIINIHRIDEVIFCARDIPAHVIMDKMSELQDKLVDYKIAPPESLSIIGSNSINTSGDLYVIDLNAITKIANRRNKRLLDIIVSLTLLAIYPFIFLFVRNPLGLLKNIITVILSLKSWVGYSELTDSERQRLPAIRKGVLNPFDAFRHEPVPGEAIPRINLMYARDYQIANDLNIIIKGFRELGRRS